MQPDRQRVVIDDRLLIEELLVGLDTSGSEVRTTSLWYFRACRAAVVGAGGHLSRPFEQLAQPEQAAALLTLLTLRDDVGLTDPRATVPQMAALAERHPHLNLLNLEAAATGLTLDATVWLSPKAADGILPGVLDAEGVDWRSVEPAGR